jgi:hypothetical protein
MDSLPYNFYKVAHIWNLCNSLAIESKKYNLKIDSSDEIISYVIKKAETPKGKESWNYTFIDGTFCISYMKPISEYSIPFKVGMAVVI